MHAALYVWLLVPLFALQPFSRPLIIASIAAPLPLQKVTLLSTVDMVKILLWPWKNAAARVGLPARLILTQATVSYCAARCFTCSWLWPLNCVALAQVLL